MDTVLLTYRIKSRSDLITKRIQETPAMKLSEKQKSILPKLDSFPATVSVVMKRSFLPDRNSFTSVQNMFTTITGITTPRSLKFEFEYRGSDVLFGHSIGLSSETIMRP